MSVILSNIVKNTTDINDEVISGSMLSSAKSAADAYLNATMTSTTPELRALYSASLNEVVGGHSALTELAVNKGWVNPYNSPTEQLSDVVDKSQSTI
ncbi:spore coat protein [Clostridium carboxidivorans P7]|uniref:Coat F domain protein n=1 Tax=Clostridium carboxidivorans P7 TaxID=536227 RepID=C6Q045_9CLOT|nr:spore coat protein [Clostridium carboxidivorans]AKN30976.1 spore coat protein [Clostridium carboxidivorans P7]EET85123.1 Coat F domain protein [Clostridium carboxidivorans P7]EFG88767.1 coat F domain protein [Clostridium carboxidivorans P7]